ncbi:MAG TPA: pilin [Candidatus Saccharimonadales bacterium]
MNTSLSHILVGQHFAAACTKTSNLFAFPNWYEYLSCTSATSPSPGSPQFTSLSDVWLIVAAVIEILLRVAALIAVGIVIYAGIQYTTSQGNPEQTSRALNTIIYAAIGLALCILSAVIVTFIARSF